MKYSIGIIAILFSLSSLNVSAFAGNKNKKTITAAPQKTKDRKQMLQWYKAMQEKGKDNAKKAERKKLKSNK